MIDHDLFLGDAAQSTLPAVRTLCFDDLTRDIAARRLPRSEFEFRSAAAKELLRRRLVPHEIGWKSSAGPLLVQQGLDDVVVEPEFTRDMVAQVEQNGHDIISTEYVGATHGTILDASERQTLDWLATRFAR